MSGLTPTTVHKDRSAPGGGLQVRALPGSLEFAALLADMKKMFPVQLRKESARVRKWFDTDDWRLFREDLLLFQEQGQWYLFRRNTWEPIASFSGDGAGLFRFAGDFPVSRLRTMLEPVLGVRALLPLVTLESKTDCVRILNRDGKTVVLVYFDDYTVTESGAGFRTVTLRGMRGYDSNLNDVSGFFSRNGIGEDVSIHSALAEGVRSVGRRPGDYSSSFTVDLQPEMSARQAMVKIYGQLLATIRHNEPGIVRDLDTEFLHDFRVAVRRTRSGLGQVRKILPPESEVKARKGFSWLGSITGPTRDLDVYLLGREKYMSRLPERLRPQLVPFFEDMEKRRAREQKKLVRNLQSAKYRDLILWWEGYLQGADLGGETANSSRPVIELAREIIFRRYRRVMKKGRSVRSASSDEEMHRLRIQCKKLRYALEFFALLFSAKKMKLAVRQLKRLQDNLGTFNDLSVQQDMLRNYLAGLRPGSRKNQELATAIGGLLTQLHHEQQAAKREFAQRFDHFAGKDNRELYRGLFG